MGVDPYLGFIGIPNGKRGDFFFCVCVFLIHDLPNHHKFFGTSMANNQNYAVKITRE